MLLLNAPIGVFDIEDLEAESAAGLTIEQHLRKRKTMIEEAILGFEEAVHAPMEKVAKPDPVDGTCNITTTPALGSAGEDAGDEV